MLVYKDSGGFRDEYFGL